MFGVIVAMMLGGVVPVALPSIQSSGRCLAYPSAQHRDHIVQCTGVIITDGRNSDDVLVQFGGLGDGNVIGFAGPVSGHSMIIKRIYAKPGHVIPASRGRCNIYYNREVLAGISCVGSTASERYLANFRASNQ